MDSHSPMPDHPPGSPRRAALTSGIPGRIRLLNGAFDVLDQSSLLEEIEQTISQGERGWLSTVNVAILMGMRHDPALQSFVDRSRWIIADGQPLVWYSRLDTPPLPERVAGIDLVLPLCAWAEASGHSVYLLGATSQGNARLRSLLAARFPKLRLAGRNGYFSDDQSAQIAHDIRAFNADILLVGMGSPRQEMFIDQHWRALDTRFAAGLGGSFDVLAGLRRRAPPWMQRVGAEWLFRLAQEPRRLCQRYAKTNSEFIGLLIRERLLQRKQRHRQ